MIASTLAVNAGAVSYADNFPNTHRNTGRNLEDLIAVAKTQIGYTELNTVTGKPLVPGQDGGYTKYGAWFGMPTVAWCAFFVTWCSDQAGISTDVIPRMGNCAAIAKWFAERGRYFKRGELMPRTGDLIFYNWAGGSSQKHIGIVTGVSSGRVYTVEGNTGSRQGYRCEAKSRSVNAGYIIGYARPDYNDAETYVGSYSFAQYAAQKYKYAQSQTGAYLGGDYKITSTLAVITSSATGVSAESATLHGRIENRSSYPVTSGGFYFGKNKNSLSKYKTQGWSAKKTVELECDIADYYGDLEMLTEYYYRSYAVVNGKRYQGPLYKVRTVDDRPQMLVFSEERLSMKPGETREIFSAVLPLDARNDGLLWISSDTDKAEVNDGVIKAKATGTAVITAMTVYGSVSESCVVNITLPCVDNFRSENVSENEIKLRWENDDLPEITRYEIYRSELPDEGFELIASAGKNEAEYTDKTVQAGCCYYYRIKSAAVSEEFDSPLSEPIREKALPAAPEIKSACQNRNGVLLEIDCKAGNSGCTVYRSMNEKYGYSPVGKTCGSYYFDGDIVSGEKYYYRVSAQGEFAQSRISLPYAKETTRIFGEDDFIMNTIFPQKTSDEKRTSRQIYKFRRAEDKFSDPCELVGYQ